MTTPEESRSLWDDGPLYSFGAVPVSELFEVWVDHHGLTVRESAMALAVQLELTGYPQTPWRWRLWTPSR